MGTLECDVARLAADVGTIDVLARLQLEVRRRGGEIRFVRASRELRALVDLVGLGDVLRVEVERQPE
jgi:ABC-type transporter Mla MlaB component